MHLLDARQRDDPDKIADGFANDAALADRDDRADDGALDRTGNGRAGRTDARRFAFRERAVGELNRFASDNRSKRFGPSVRKRLFFIESAQPSCNRFAFAV